MSIKYLPTITFIEPLSPGNANNNNNIIFFILGRAIRHKNDYSGVKNKYKNLFITFNFFIFYNK